MTLFLFPREVVKISSRGNKIMHAIIYNKVLLFAQTIIRWYESILNKNEVKTLIFLSESFGDSNKSHTFASAFENERNLKQNEIEKSSGKADKERVLWKDLHKTDKVVQEARTKKFVLG